MVSTFLVANLSIPASDEEKLKEAFQNALQWEYSKYTNPIYALYLLQPKTAIVYAQKELIDELLNRKTDNAFQLGGPMSATFFNGDVFPSNCIDVNFKNSNLPTDQQLALLNSIQEAKSITFSAFQKENSFTLRFSTIEETTEGCEKVLAYSKENNISLTAHVITVSDHVILRCSWKGTSSLAATIKRLKSTGQNLTNLVQSCLR